MGKNKTLGMTMAASPGEDPEQEVHTPEWILEAARVALGGVILVDPCAASSPEHHFAVRNVYEPTTYITTPAGKIKPVYPPPAVGSWDGGFLNPPYGPLEEWLVVMAARAALGDRMVFLGPVRPHRTWWSKALASAAEVVYLRPFAFRGHKSNFPAPTCLAAWNCRLPLLTGRETGRSKISVWC